MMPIKIRVMLVFISAKIRNAWAKVAMSSVPIIAPKQIAKKVFHGVIPKSLPTIDPTRPPDP